MGLSPDQLSITDEQRIGIKSDKRYLVLALQQAGRLLQKDIALTADACKCPFHHDDQPSGSLFQDQSPGRQKTWMYKCHGCGDWNQVNPGTANGSGDAIAVLQAAHRRIGKSLSFPDACRWLLNAAAPPVEPDNPAEPQLPPSLQVDCHPYELQKAEQQAIEAHQALLSNPALLSRLSNERAVDRATATRFRVGYLDESSRQWWVFEIRHPDGRFMAIKLHAADGKSPKSQWRPSNAKQGHPLFGVDVNKTDPVWLCPGEFKALAVISLDLSAVGITSGEKCPDVTEELRQLLTGRQVAVVGDNDATGDAWARSICEQLSTARIDCRNVNLQFTRSGEDIEDWIVRQRVDKSRSPNDVGRMLTEAFSKSSKLDTGGIDPPHSDHTTAHEPPSSNPQSQSVRQRFTRSVPSISSLGEIWVQESTWQPARRVATGIDELDDVLGGGLVVGGVTFITGKAGNAKTQLVLQMATNAAIRGVRVGLISVEMTKAETGRLLLAQLSRVPRSVIDCGITVMHDPTHKRAVTDAMRRRHSLPIDVVDAGEFSNGFSRDDLRDFVAYGASTRNWEVVVFDHLGELTPPPGDPGNQPIEDDKKNMVCLRAMAREHDLAFVAVAPMRKATSSKDPKKGHYTLDDLHGAAILGYAAHACLAVIAKPAVDALHSSRVFVSVLKNRTGRTPQEPIQLWWHSENGHIESMPSAPMDAPTPPVTHAPSQTPSHTSGHGEDSDTEAGRVQDVEERDDHGFCEPRDDAGEQTSEAHCEVSTLEAIGDAVAQDRMIPSVHETAIG